MNERRVPDHRRGVGIVFYLDRRYPSRSIGCGVKKIRIN